MLGVRCLLKSGLEAMQVYRSSNIARAILMNCSFLMVVTPYDVTHQVSRTRCYLSRPSGLKPATFSLRTHHPATEIIKMFVKIVKMPP